ncbi:MAG: NAD(P)/FAD-dependent oxidoreductase, partial [Pyrodictiaceae archaeon]
SGIINLRPDIGGDLDKLLGSWSRAYELVRLVDKIFVRFGADKSRLFKPDKARASELERRAVKAGAKFVVAEQRHIGSDKSRKVIANIVDYIKSHGIAVSPLTKVAEITRSDGGFILKTSRGEFKAKRIILAPGRSGAQWLAWQAGRLGIETEPGPLDVGIRVEVPYNVMEPLTSVMWDPKIIFFTKTFDDKVRTFCTNPGGYVITEYYEDGTIGVNGETYSDRHSMNTNFALLATVKLTDPMEDAIDYGKSIARIATKLGGGKPLIQRLGDLEAGRRSTWERIQRSLVEPTLKDVTPGDISMAIPYRILLGIMEALEKLDDLAPGVWSKHTLLYAPEIKYYSVKVLVDKRMETTVKGIYAAGDGAGLSRGINVAAATGLIAGTSILEDYGLEPRLDPLVEN